MASAQRDKLKKLLTKVNLSGFEAAKIALAELWEGEHARDPFLSDSEQKAIIDRLTRPEEIRIYNDWIGIFSTICEINYTAHITCLEAQRTLLSLEIILEHYVTAAIIELQERMRPDILTETQLLNLAAEERKTSLKEQHSLEWILFERADRLVEQEDDSLENVLEENPEKAVLVYKQACSEIRQLIESKRLKITYGKSVLNLLRKIETAKADEEVLALIDSTLSAEPKYRPREPEPILEKATTSGKALYETNLPEWVEWIESYHHDGMSGVAVLQNPSERDLDNRGYYKDERRLVENHCVRLTKDEYWKAIGVTPQALFTIRLKETRLEISYFLFCRSVMKMLVQTTGIPFSDDVDIWYISLEFSLKCYEEIFNTAVGLSHRAKEAFAGMPPIIDMGELHPSADLENLIRNRLTKPLKKLQWFQDCKEYNVKERFSSVPREELEEMFSGMGKENRKRLFKILEEKDHPDPGSLAH